jgi:hypothetical protein
LDSYFPFRHSEQRLEVEESRGSHLQDNASGSLDFARDDYCGYSHFM